MPDETTENTEAETTATEAAVTSEAPAKEEKPAAPVEEVFCAVSKQMVPLDETVEIERKKGEVLRIHARYKKFED